MITYTSDISVIEAGMLKGFFIDWPHPPTPQKHFEILQKSYKFFAALDENKVVGFINAVSDDVLAAYIPLLEVLPDYQGKGIGGKLLQLMLTELEGLYMIDLTCDQEMQDFYHKFEMRPIFAMGKRNYEKQNGKK